MNNAIPLSLPFDPDRDRVVTELQKLDPTGERVGQTIRDTYDQLYDGARTQRYRWDQLYKTEKTHFGTIIEINLQREFEFVDGDKLDYKIAAREIDAKYSQKYGGWMLPPEAVGELCLVITANDYTSEYSIGVVRANEALLNEGSNRDAKRTLSAQGRDTIAWLQRNAELPPNTLLHMKEEDLDSIFNAGKATARVSELFRRSIGQIISRSAIATVATQLDITRRVRGGEGGSRSPLASEGIVILGGAYEWQREAARKLGLPTPRRTEYVAGYVAPATADYDGPSALGPSGLKLRTTSINEKQPFSPAWYSK